MVATLFYGALLGLWVVEAINAYASYKRYKVEDRYNRWRNEEMDRTFGLVTDLLIEATNAVRAVEKAYKEGVTEHEDN